MTSDCETWGEEVWVCNLLSSGLPLSAASYFCMGGHWLGCFNCCCSMGGQSSGREHFPGSGQGAGIGMGISLHSCFSWGHGAGSGHGSGICTGISLHSRFSWGQGAASGHGTGIGTGISLHSCFS